MSAQRHSKPKLMVIEDDLGLQNQLKWCFEGYDVRVVGDRDNAISTLRRFEPPVVTLDLGLPPDAANASEGFKLLEEILSLAPDTKIVVVTGNDDRDNAVKAIAMGAYDFYQKPVDPDILRLIVDRAAALYELERENLRLAQGQQASPLGGVIAISPQMSRVCRMIEKVAPTDAAQADRVWMAG